MRTKLNTVHEEAYVQSNRVLGVLFNYSIEQETENWKECFIYTYNDEMYIFFNTMIDLVNYLLYGEHKMKRAYMEESEFDYYYDMPFIDGSFNDKLKWTE